MENFKTLASFFKALGEENRLRILKALKEGELSVGDLVIRLEISQPLVSHHLRELKLANLVKSRKEGPYVFYQLKTSKIFELIRLAKSLTEETNA
ncbi:MAG: transcriptional regulator [Thermodesulfatator sp.]|nr:MAG: transcriptional regulator [Thermodesulfatator sp.]